MRTPKDINTDILNYLGVDWTAKNIAGITLCMRGGRFPTLAVHRHLTSAMSLREKIERFGLRPICAARQATESLKVVDQSGVIMRSPK